MKDNLTIRQFLENYDKGMYEESDFNTQCAAGWFDWFCSTRALAAKTKKLAGKLKTIVKSSKIDIDKMYVFFKNNCPCDGTLYDDFRICSFDPEDTTPIYTITPALGYNNEDRGKSEVWGKENNFQGPLVTGTWDDVREFFGTPKKSKK
jgi:hypothetical protein